MEPTILTYLGFFVAVIIIIWAALEFRSRLWRMRDHEAGRRNIWVKLDPKQGPPMPEETHIESEQDEDAEEHAEQNLHARARQNGHHSETKYPL